MTILISHRTSGQNREFNSGLPSPLLVPQPLNLSFQSVSRIDFNVFLPQYSVFSNQVVIKGQLHCFRHYTEQ